MKDKITNFTEIQRQVTQSLNNVLGKKVANISLENRLIEDLGVDSFVFLELIFELEDTLGVKIPDGEVKKMITVGDVVIFIHDAIVEEQNAH